MCIFISKWRCQLGSQMVRGQVRAGDLSFIIIPLLDIIYIICTTYIHHIYVYTHTVDFEQHGFELCGSTYLQIFFNSWLNPCMWNYRYRGPTMGLEHLWILISVAGPGTNPLWILKDDCIYVYIFTYTHITCLQKNLLLNILSQK